ncbi:MAG TPA: hypothetical protein VFR70_07960, partial [Flavobacterium sp.]|nr:hypothetical protein [Flavobacterium sp.]
MKIRNAIFTLAAGLAPFKIGLAAVLSLAASGAQAQITSIAMDVEDLKDAPFKYRGSRAMMADRIDDASSKNI